MSTATSRATRLISAVALNPSVSGIARSMMITFGLSITFRLDRFPAGGGLADQVDV
jgi:hypothetical protein